MTSVKSFFKYIFPHTAGYDLKLDKYEWTVLENDKAMYDNLDQEGWYLLLEDVYNRGAYHNYFMIGQDVDLSGESFSFNLDRSIPIEDLVVVFAMSNYREPSEGYYLDLCAQNLHLSQE